LLEKYQRLIQEYSKIKAQNAILKKAVITEQEKNEELQNALKSQEQLLRKNKQELENLEFHNESLTKRVAALQSDLASNPPKSSNSWLSLNKHELKRKSELLNATETDLLAKIEENEQLHNEMSEVKGSLNKKITALQNTIALLDQQLQELKASSSRKIEDQEKEISSIKYQLQVAENKCLLLQSELEQFQRERTEETEKK